MRLESGQVARESPSPQLTGEPARRRSFVCLEPLSRAGNLASMLNLLVFKIDRDLMLLPLYLTIRRTALSPGTVLARGWKEMCLQRNDLLVKVLLHCFETRRQMLDHIRKSNILVEGREEAPYQISFVSKWPKICSTISIGSPSGSSRLSLR